MDSEYTRSIHAFISLELYAGIGFIFLQLTAFLSPNVRRGRVWYCFCSSWTFFCVPCCLLFFAGQQFTKQPSHGICLAQTCLVYSGPPFIMGAALSLLLELHWRISFAISGQAILAKRAESPLLLAGPIALWLALTLAYAIFGMSSSGKVIRATDNDPYCYFDNDAPRNFNSIVCVVLALVDVVLLGLILRTIIRHKNASIPYQYKGTVTRLVIMMSLGLIAFVATVILMVEEKVSIAVNIAGQACLPAAVVTLFGSQKDFLVAWKEAAKNVFRISRAAETMPKSQV